MKNYFREKGRLKIIIIPVFFLVITFLFNMDVDFVFAQFEPELFSGMKARSIGPAGMSGRIGAVEAVVSNPNIIYVGAATGGVWKSTNGGTTFKPIFDSEPASSIGAIAVFQRNPSIVWVGTGEGNPRNSSGVGNGVYKSLDGGDTWKFMGLDSTEKIHRIILHPSNPEIVYVAALGTTWGENPERGVFKTTDGGKSWKKILYVDKKTGCADLVMDPVNPNKLFAAMWEHRRWPWFFKSGGPGSGLYVTYDGGENWKKITDREGLPEGTLGRIGVAVARSNPDVVYALVEAKKSALCRSEDGGKTWKIVNKSKNIAPRPFYYADIRVDPENENRIYSLHSTLTVSTDGGKSFKPLSPSSRVHPDHHSLWINPEDGRILIDGNDGGIAISMDRGKTWRFVENIPVAQFYHINVDMEIPYNIYGGLQDNGSWKGPSDVWENGGIRNYHWEEVGFGDGFATLSDPLNPEIGYCMSQGGNLMRFNLITGERKSIRPAHPEGVELRFNWNAAIAIDPFNPMTVYYGSQFIHKSTDRGDTWTIISPDLTTNDPEKQKQRESGGLTMDVTAAENHTTIITIAPSPVDRNIIWAGTDDGNVQVTTDGGKNWTNVVGNIPDLPPNTWCPHIEASKFDASTAFAVFDDHRRSNWTTYIYKTTDFGKSWENLAKNDPVKDSAPACWGFAHTIVQDPVKKDLLYLGTEFGLYISFDGGKHWMKWTHGLPTAPVRALIVHPREHDLVIGTHGRAAYILDNIRPLRTVTREIFDKPLYIFEIPPAYQHQIKQVGGYHFPADAMFRGESRPYGAMITYSVNLPEKSKSKDKKEKKVDIEIIDSSGKIIRKMKGPMKKGINRVYWNLRRDGFKMPRIGEQQRRMPSPGPEILPGTYTVKIKSGKNEVSGKVEVLPDPRVSITMEERQKKYDTIIRAGKRIEIITEAVNRIQNTKKSINTILEQIKNRKDAEAKEIRKSAENLKKTLSGVLDKLLGPQEKQGILARDITAIGKLSGVYRSLQSSWDAPTEAQMIYLKQAEDFLGKTLVEFNRVFDEDVKAFKQKVESAGISLFPEREPLNLNWEPEK
ncbi:hypothetical protein DRQ09_01235 [candidate division KSB1 bacterium]|nr:MAG: hypothetical protein DRQ09_01235 [candidate division KSB1 bacterium]